MIILSGVLVVVAIALLVAGIVADSGDSAQVLGVDALVVIYTSIAVSLVSFLCLAIGVFLRRKELFGEVPAPAAAPPRKARSGRKDKKEKKKGAKSGRSAAVPAPAAPSGTATPGKDAGAAPADETLDIPVQPTHVPDEALVYVVRGRRRYHLDTCRQLAGRDKDELTYIEAKEEGFSPCTACMPDTALAARAAVSVPARSGAQSRSSSSASTSASSSSSPSSTSASSPSAEPVTGSGRSSSAPTEPVPVKPTLDKGAPDKAASDKGTPDKAASDKGTPDKSAPPSAWPLPGAASASAASPRSSAGASAQEPAKDTPGGDAPSKADAKGDAADTPSADTTVTRPITTTAPKADAPKPDVPAQGEAHADAPAAKQPGAADDGGPQVRILSGTKRYHRVDCALIEDIGDEADDLETLSRAEAVTRGCTPCLVCQPDRDQASS